MIYFLISILSFSVVFHSYLAYDYWKNNAKTLFFANVSIVLTAIVAIIGWIL